MQIRKKLYETPKLRMMLLRLFQVIEENLSSHTITKLLRINQIFYYLIVDSLTNIPEEYSFFLQGGTCRY